MRTAGVAEIKAKLSEYLELVRGGAEVVISDRGVPVAKLVPLTTEERRGSRRERLQRAGVVVLAARRSGARRRVAVPTGPALGAQVLDALLEERGEER